MDEVEKESIIGLNIDEKLEKSKAVVRDAITRFAPDKIALAITGGKDSTTCLWIYRQVCNEMGIEIPTCIFIDEGDTFDEINQFIDYIAREWSIEVVILKNEDVSSKALNIGDSIKVSTLNEENQEALKEIDFNDAEFPFMPDSVICNHLMKTVPMNEFISQNRIESVSVAIRWDEQSARESEEYFSPRERPRHTRIHPILHFSERDIWIAIFKYDIPFNSLYKQGYRSLGARCATGKDSDIPAWMQDLENTPERVGRGQEKEEVMERLRALGYM
jgi:phosphoadenosine phosphosulfate reductase